MKSRNFLLSLGATAALGLPLFASAQVFVDVDREAGFVLVNPAPADRKAEVTRKTPVTASRAGKPEMWRETSSDAGWLFVGHEYAFKDGRLVCIDGIDHGERAESAPLDRLLHGGA